MEATRRAVLVGAAAVGAVTAFPFGPSIGEGDSWVDALPWQKANANGRHIITVRITDPTVVARAAFELRPVLRRNLTSEMFYGARPDFLGLSTFYGTRDRTRAQNAVNVLDWKSEAWRTSIWAVAWGERTISVVSDDGQAIVDSGRAAIVVTDWRYAVRIANLDPSQASQQTLASALFRLPKMHGDGIKTALYMNGECREALRREGLTSDQFRNVPIQVAPLRSDEELVS